MCSECRNNVCDCRCPSAEPKVFGTCISCGEDIMIGDEYVDLDGLLYHAECLENIAFRVLLEMNGLIIKTAEEER